MVLILLLALFTLNNSVESTSVSSSSYNVKNRIDGTQPQRKTIDSLNQPPLLGSYHSIEAIDKLADDLSNVMYDREGSYQRSIVIDFDTMPLFLEEARAHCYKTENGSIYKVSFFIASDSCRFSDIDQVGFTLPGPGFALPEVGGSIRNLPVCVADPTSFVDEFTELTCLSFFEAKSYTSNKVVGGAGRLSESTSFHAPNLALVVFGTVAATVITIGIL